MTPTVVPGEAEFPLNAWYVAAFSRELEPGKLLARKICDIRMVFYRLGDGSPAALFDRCPHRGMPFSMGKLLDTGNVQCLYHGMEFNASGQCTHVPSQDAVPAQMRVQSFPLVEKWRWIWVWPGDPERADPALIPDHDYLGLERRGNDTHDGLVMHVNANYLLPFENLVDATHISYLHHGLIDDGNAVRTPYEMNQTGRRVSMSRQIRNEVVQGRPAQDRLLILEGHAPGLCQVRQKINPSADPDDVVETNLLVALTPETRRSTHQFTAQSTSDSGRRNQFTTWEETDIFLANLLGEDVVAIEAIQILHEELAPEDRVEVSQQADIASIRTRRIIADMIVQERAAQQAAD